jgi:hypothetical protein
MLKLRASKRDVQSVNAHLADRLRKGKRHTRARTYSTKAIVNKEACEEDFK